ncbi:MAG TPA: 1-acyl-sn-glycerol-3-phosphate acyltransferase [Chitinophagaceae bacterium]|nr:1-acyl-sn-glycerol-3-phosphate acyltransferase [Chitinophagaceae bacterium]
MTWLKNIFGRLFAAWALLLFVVTMLLFMIPFLLFSYFRSDPVKTLRFLRFSRIWMKVYLTGIGCPLRIRGRDRFRPGQTYIVVCNHNSLMDVPVSSPAIPGGNKTIAKIEMARIPIFGMLYRTGSVLVDRKSESSRRESFAKMKEVLAMGFHMCIYPEGTRNKTDQPLKSFHDGAFRLSLETGHAILPAIILNTRKILPADKMFFLWPHRMEIHFLEPLTPFPGMTLPQLKEDVFQRMAAYYTSHQH